MAGHKNYRPAQKGTIRVCALLLGFVAGCSFDPDVPGATGGGRTGDAAQPPADGGAGEDRGPVTGDGGAGADAPDLSDRSDPSDRSDENDSGQVADVGGLEDTGTDPGDGGCNGCTSPPASSCADPHTLATYETPGTCANDVCSYTSSTKECYYGCSNGKCVDCTPDCAGKECGDDGCGESCGMCDKAPADSCTGANTVRDYDLEGTCVSNKCEYRYTDRNCQYGCLGGACKGCQPDCGGKECGDNGCGGSCGTCNDPPSDYCFSASTLRKYNASGACAGSTCNYTYIDQSCQWGCAGGKCNPCPPDCSGKNCGDNGCGGTCGSCSGNDVCAAGVCGPVALAIVYQGVGPGGTCPAGYANAGRWKTYPFSSDGGTEASDYKGQIYDYGWVTICSADSANIYVALGGSDCGGAENTCTGVHRGAWHVGSGCTGSPSAYDKNGTSMLAGWVALCVVGNKPAKVETGLDDCGGQTPGCGSWPVEGQWHVGGDCGGGVTGGGADGTTIKGGWMHMCVQ